MHMLVRRDQLGLIDDQYKRIWHLLILFQQSLPIQMGKITFVFKKRNVLLFLKINLSICLSLKLSNLDAIEL